MARKSKRRLISAVALFAMALRLVVAFLFVPATILPGTPAEAGFQVVLCTEHGPMQVALDGRGEPVSGDRQEKPNSPPICPFCYAGAAIPFAVVPPIAGPPQIAGEPPLETPALAVFPERPRVFAATARGPPLSVI